MFDLVIRNGTVIDGTGMARYRADVGVVGRTIAKIGRIRERGVSEIDAEGHFVTPGFIDGHTHLDAQVSWDPMAGSDSMHGVTTVLMGNCSFSLAPCKEADKDLVFTSLERSEDVPRDVLLQGVQWDWETFGEYLDAIERVPKGVNYAGLVGHSALRTYVMGERAFEAAATESQMEAMCDALRDAMRAGAFGWSSSRRTAHLTSDGRPVASRQATWNELFALGDVLAESGVGVIQGLGGSQPNEDVELVRANMLKLAVDSGRPLLESGIRNSDVERLPFWAESTRVGGRMVGFVRPKRFELVMGFRVKLPFDTLDSWKPVRALPIDEQQAIFRNPDRRAALVHDALTLPSGSMIGAEARPPVYEKMYLMDEPLGTRRTVAEIAAERGISPVDAIVDLSLETDFQQLFTQPDDDLTELNDECLLEMLRHPNTVMAGSDTGAHTTQSIDANFPTTLLGKWVRQREEFTWEEAVRMLTFEPAFVWGFQGRGVLQPGFAADLVVFDPKTVGPGTPYTDYGLPGGAPQLREQPVGIHSVIVGGAEVLRDNQPTGALPGEVLRSGAYTGERTMMQRIHHWIDGRVVESGSGRSAPVFDPASGEQSGVVGLASVDEVDRAVAVAKAAFGGWRGASLSRRAEVLFRLRELVDANRKEIASLLTAEHGKVLSDAMGEVARGLENIEFACGVPHLLKGGFSEQASTGVDVYSIRQPLGVVAGITPFNFPAMVPMWMFANALACGNAFVLKPSEKDPSASLLMAELLAQAGLPAGVFNVVQGDKVAVDRLLEHPDVAAISFVGSTPIARHIYETGTRNGKRVQALGGAKNHMLVLADADLDMAADAAIGAAYGSAGERCMAISVVLAADAVADDLVAKIRDRIADIKVGPGTEPGVEMGPLVTAEHRDKVTSYITGAAAEGATVVVDGTIGLPDTGFFVNPTLLDHVEPGMACYDDEIFGPVLSVKRVHGYTDGVDVINANPYANGTAIFTRDGGAARQFQYDVEVGMVGINVPIPVPVSYYSFGGWKASLFGDTHMYGPEGINFYTRGKVVTTRWPDPAHSTIDLGFPETR